MTAITLKTRSMSVIGIYRQLPAYGATRCSQGCKKPRGTDVPSSFVTVAFAEWSRAAKELSDPASRQEIIARFASPRTLGTLGSEPAV